ncbi:hypothetical protein Halar_0004 (plasmid) [halophilic archaeon DL31]|jgi:inner membrane protein|nr:hypothetical protein Halar_0004 [halophilic archaeon DL31]
MHREGHYGVALLAYAPVAFVLLGLGLPTLTGVGGAVVGLAGVVVGWNRGVLTALGLGP